MNRTCTKCGLVLPATREFFHACSTGYLGLHAECRDCGAKRSRAYHEAHRDELAAKRVAFVAAHREEVNAQQRASYAKHRGKRRAGSVAYNQAHLDERRAYRLQYDAAHPGVAAAKSREARLRDPEAYNAGRRAYRAQNAAVVMFREWREESGCAVCGESDYRVLQGHHIDPAEKDCSLTRVRNAAVMAAELAKCIPLCANHHILVHEELRNGHKGCAMDEVIEYLKEMSHV